MPCAVSLRRNYFGTLWTSYLVCGWSGAAGSLEELYEKERRHVCGRPGEVR